ncbi:LPS export ABC transporter permease LptF [Prosthecomicrobium pneumaticum]|uniref:Lipopolysaccharide export system permease protein n=1 Tax=Prosthecomicrobium pneumaticum TaxID=81895 RepID=A0A7W9FJ93_9HYPH|nr:LPS export ABC transporter permease LptF [Prosthecomicrobium pneumaticum]MBB5751482.1 lipopolysaccharide export system permease protein [Prosthecomicrobium pneumaticum]
MKLIERHIFRRMLGACVLSLVALSGTVWLSQALRELDLVTAKSQSFVIFFQITALILPGLILVVLPVAVIIAVLFTLNQLNADSELVVINASGASQMTVLRPALRLGILATAVSAVMSLWLVPDSLRSWREMMTQVTADVISTVIREGQFMPLGKDLVFHVREKRPDGTMRGIFVLDERDPAQQSVYIAEQGALLRNPIGTFLIMHNGTIQQQSRASDAVSMIAFESYAFDLSSFATRDGPARYQAADRSTLWLLSPDPKDPGYRKDPGRYTAELHERLSSPFYAFLFALIPVAALGQARTTRQGRGMTILGAVLIASGARVGGFLASGVVSGDLALVPLLYAIPIGLSALALALVLTGVRIDGPEALGAFLRDRADRLFGRGSG